ncbi:sulfate ABC transporter permease subunit CysT [Pendulispora brunnea]|uniref:Sulfate transport system permease protein CysT n=1 Tax=Pendulispora brunnea TaxID=2905690 RepID=A0ABZ2KBI8_9BACT
MSATAAQVQRRTLPGFRLTMGFTLLYLALIVLVPLSGLFGKTKALGLGEIVTALTQPRVLAAFRLSLGAAVVAAIIDSAAGLLIAWVLVRYTFFGKRIIEALIDIPLALPTAVAGIALTTAYSENGVIGRHFAAHGIQVAFTQLGVTVALVFVGLPFAVRAVQPVLADIEIELEEAAHSLGATRGQIFRRVTFPLVLPAIVSGGAQAFARAVGEYGSVVFISGNMPMKTEIVPLLIVTKLEQYDYAGATALAATMLLLSLGMLILLHRLQGAIQVGGHP